MPGIFINYRRSHTPGYAGRLFDHLSEHFGEEQVFRDIDRIEPGRDFARVIDESVAQCDALLVLIGAQWLTVEGEDGRRIHDPEDFVRFEISKALAQDVRIIPVLLPGATKMPEAAELPDDLVDLARRQAIKLSDESWTHDVQRLISALERCGVEVRRAPPQSERRQGPPERVNPQSLVDAVSPPAAPQRSRMPQMLAAIALLAVTALFGLVLSQSQRSTEEDLGPEVQALLAGDSVSSPAGITSSPLAQMLQLDRQGPPGSGAAGQPSPHVQSAQLLLSNLGYEPGLIDGISGQQTAGAIREFQRTQGLTVDGVASQQLVDALRAAASQQVGRAGGPPGTRPLVGASLPGVGASLPSAGVARGAPVDIAASSLTGRWFDEDGVSYQLLQQGDRVVGQAVDPASGRSLGRVEGTFRAGILDYRYVTALGQNGSGRGTLEPDGAHMTTLSADSTTGQSEAGRLHRGHLSR